MNKTRRLAIICMIAAVYTVVSTVLAPITYGNIQCRISEALALLPIIYAPAVPALILGCFLTNLIGAITGANILGFMDCIVGTLATALAAYTTYKFAEKRIKGLPLISIAAPVVFNGLIIGQELALVLFPAEIFLKAYAICALEVAAGEMVAVILGYFMIKAMKKADIFNKLNA